MLTHRQVKSLQRNILACLLLAAAGAWISGEFVKVHAGLWRDADAPTGVFGALCSATAAWGFSCAEAGSTWSSFRLPLLLPTSRLGLQLQTLEIPLAFVGLAYFVLLGSGVWLAPRERLTGRWRSAAGLCLGVAAAFSAGYFATMVVGVAPRCSGCLVVHAVNLMLVVQLLRVDRRLPMPAEHAAVVPIGFGLHSRALMVGLALVTALWLYRADRIAVQAEVNRLLPYRSLVRQIRKDPDFLVRTFEAQPQIDGLTSDAGDGRSELVVFVDYECQPCYCKTRGLVEKLAATAGDRLSVRYRHYPLNTVCNPAVTHDVHPHACEAAWAAEAARQMGGDAAFARMHQALFENRRLMADASFPALAASIGLDEAVFARAMVSDAVRARVAADIAVARQAEVVGTPTMILNGRKVPPLVDTPVFWKAIAAQSGLIAEGEMACATCQRGCKCEKTTGAASVTAPDAHDAGIASVQ